MAFEVYDRVTFLEAHPKLYYPKVNRVLHDSKYNKYEIINPTKDQSLLFDNIVNGTFNAPPYNVMYWREIDSDYYMLTLEPGKFDIYRCGHNTYPGEKTPLTMLKYNFDTKETTDVTSLYSQEATDMPSINNSKVMLSFKDVIGGTYVFYLNKTRLRLDSEWYIVKKSITKKVIIIKNEIFIPDSNLNLIKIGDTPLTKNIFDKIQNDNTELFTQPFLNSIKENFRIGKIEDYS